MMKFAIGLWIGILAGGLVSVMAQPPQVAAIPQGIPPTEIIKAITNGSFTPFQLAAIEQRIIDLEKMVLKLQPAPCKGK